MAAAKSWKRDVDRAFERGELTGSVLPRVKDAWREWLDGAERGIVLARGDKPYRPSTLRGYRQAMAAETAGELLELRLDQLSRRRLGDHVRGLQAQGLAAQTVKNLIVPLRALYRYAIQDLELQVVNPTERLRVPAGSGRRMNVRTAGEIVPLLEALLERDRALWATAFYAGLRRGELMALRWADVELGAGVVTVRMSYDQPSRTMGAVKSTAGQDRRVPIIAALRDYLTEHRARAGGRPGGLVFCRGSLAGADRGHRGPLDAPFADQTVSTRAKDCWHGAGLRAVTLHDCRHTFASLMIAAMAEAGRFNPKALQMMLGHASIQQTFDRYGHLFPGTEEEAGRMLDEYLSAAVASAEMAALPAVTEPADVGCVRQAGVPRTEIRRAR